MRWNVGLSCRACRRGSRHKEQSLGTREALLNSDEQEDMLVTLHATWGKSGLFHLKSKWLLVDARSSNEVKKNVPKQSITILFPSKNRMANKLEIISTPSCFLITHSDTERAFSPAVYASRVSRQHRQNLCPLTRRKRKTSFLFVFYRGHFLANQLFLQMTWL